MNPNLNMFQFQRLHLSAKIFSFITPNPNIPLVPRNLSHSSSSVKIWSSRHLVNKSVSEKFSGSFDKCNCKRSTVTRRKNRYYAPESGFLMFAFGVYSSEKDLLEAFKRPVAISDVSKTQAPKPITNVVILDNEKAVVGLVGAALVLTVVGVGPASAAELPLLASSLQLSEPSNALSLPTWAVHVSSVVEWITAMALVWQYGEKSGYEAWKGLSWGMVPLLGGAFCACTWHFFYNSESLEVPLLGGAFCACTWHFFYNSESLEVLVALQAALTVIGNATMCYAAFRIYKSSEERS